MDCPRLRIGSPVKLTDVQLAEFLHNRHRAVGGAGNDLGGLGGTTQRRCVDGGGAGFTGESFGQHGGLGDAKLSQRVVNDPVRQPTGRLVGWVMPVPDVPGNDPVTGWLPPSGIGESQPRNHGEAR